MSARSVVLLVVAALLVDGSLGACSDITNNARRASCELWDTILDAFGNANWSVCANEAKGSLPCGGCASTQGLIACYNNRVTQVKITSEIGMVFDPAYTEELKTRLAAAQSGNILKLFQIENQANLNLGQCFADECSAISGGCSFANSECFDYCSTDGQCATLAPTGPPTLAPTSPPTDPTEAPTPAPTPPTPLPTPAPTPPTPSPTERPTTGPTFSPTKAPTDGACLTRYSEPHEQRSCLAWNAMADTFHSENWERCDFFYDKDPCGYLACPKNNGMVECDDRGRLKRIIIRWENGMHYDGVTDMTPFEDAFLALKQNDGFKSLRLGNQNNLNIRECIPRLCNEIDCIFFLSDVSGTSKSNGQCK